MHTDSFTLSSQRIWFVAVAVAVLTGATIVLSGTLAPWSIAISIILGSCLVTTLEFLPLSRLPFFANQQSIEVYLGDAYDGDGEWSKEMEARFNELATMEVLATISEEDNRELTELQAIRRASYCPLSTDQLFQESKRRETYQQLLKTLKEYIKEHESKNRKRDDT
jgi:hypothetical protein